MVTSSFEINLSWNINLHLMVTYLKNERQCVSTEFSVKFRASDFSETLSRHLKRLITSCERDLETAKWKRCPRKTIILPVYTNQSRFASTFRKRPSNVHIFQIFRIILRFARFLQYPQQVKYSYSFQLLTLNVAKQYKFRNLYQ